MSTVIINREEELRPIPPAQTTYFEMSYLTSEDGRFPAATHLYAINITVEAGIVVISADNWPAPEAAFHLPRENGSGDLYMGFRQGLPIPANARLKFFNPSGTGLGGSSSGSSSSPGVEAEVIIKLEVERPDPE